jgi:hypothetical protein
MQALIDKIFDNKIFMFAASVLALLLALALILFIFRLSFGHRLKTSGGGRTRLPRLGIVDAFNLDRHRQLVIVRRDNVEHLLMIGGPNDLVIESEIIRAEGRDLRVREKEVRERDSREPPPPTFQAPAPGVPPWRPEFDPVPLRAGAAPPQSHGKSPVPPPSPVAPPAELDAPPPGPVFEESLAPLPADPPAPRPPAFPLPPRRAASPPLRAPREPLGRSDFLSRLEGVGAGQSGSFPRAPLATPVLRPSPPAHPENARPKPPASSQLQSAPPDQAGDPETATPPAVVALAEPVSLSAVGAPAQKPSTPPAAPPDKVAEDARERSWLAAEPSAPADPTIRMSPSECVRDSLEEEMARLLGRGS